MYKKNTIAIVVTYNRLELLKENINALTTCIGLENILVVDNHSTDGTDEYLEDEHITYIRMQSNEGGAGGFSRGIEEGIKRGYKYLWIMDDDTIVYPDSLNKLLDASETVKSNFGFLASYVEWTDHTPCIMNIPELMPGLNRDEIEYESKGIIKCNRASFVSMLINRDAVIESGLPIKEFFIWGDDTEYSNRLAKALPCYFVPSSIVLHKMKNNTPTDIITDSEDRLERYKLLYRNQTYMARMKGKKNSNINTLWILYQILKVVKSSTSKKMKRIKIILSGWNAGRHFNPQIKFVDN